MANIAFICISRGKGRSGAEESRLIEDIVKEYYDPDVSLLSEEELEEIIAKYGGDTLEDEDTFDMDLVEKYYDPNMTPISMEELEEILIEHGDEAWNANAHDHKDMVEDKEIKVKGVRKKIRKRKTEEEEEIKENQRILLK